MINLRTLVTLDCFTMLPVQRYACVLDMYAAIKNRLEKTVTRAQEEYDK